MVKFSSVHAMLWEVSDRVSSPQNIALTYLRPIQTRGPYEKGCDASRSSPESLSSQRSGLNVNGSLKLAVDMEAANGFVDTVICSKHC